jgi:hypothetical protein
MNREVSRTNNLLFCSGYNTPTLFRHLRKEDFSMQSEWCFPNKLPTMVHNQAFCIELDAYLE